MIFSYPITVQPNTPQYAPLQFIDSLGVRHITHGKIYFRDGLYRSVGVRLLDRGRQFFPRNGWAKGNNETVEWSEDHILEGPPFEITIEMYSEAEDWPHTITINLEIFRQ